MMKVKSLVLTGLLLLWATGTAGAFWHWEGQYLRPASRPRGAATAAPGALPPAAAATLATDRGPVRLGAGQVTWVNFWNPDCPCSRFAEAHVMRLGRVYGPRGVRLLTVVECGTSKHDQQTALQAWHSRGLLGFAAAPDPGGKIARAFGVWAAPAAVILDAQGHIAYVGSYNAARFCDNAQTAWAQQALDDVLAGRQPPHRKAYFFGCQVVGQGTVS